MDVLQRAFVGFAEFCIMMTLRANSHATLEAEERRSAGGVPGKAGAKGRASMRLCVEVANPTAAQTEHVTEERGGGGGVAKRRERGEDIASRTEDHDEDAVEEKDEEERGEERWRETERELVAVFGGMGVCWAGAITADDVREVLRRFGMPLTDEEASLAVKLVDTAGTGNTQVADFARTLQGQTQHANTPFPRAEQHCTRYAPLSPLLSPGLPRSAAPTRPVPMPPLHSPGTESVGALSPMAGGGCHRGAFDSETEDAAGVSVSLSDPSEERERDRGDWRECTQAGAAHPSSATPGYLSCSPA